MCNSYFALFSLAGVFQQYNCNKMHYLYNPGDLKVIFHLHWQPFATFISIPWAIILLSLKVNVSTALWWEKIVPSTWNRKNAFWSSWQNVAQIFKSMPFSTYSCHLAHICCACISCGCMHIKVICVYAWILVGTHESHMHIGKYRPYEICLYIWATLIISSFLLSSFN